MGKIPFLNEKGALIVWSLLPPTLHRLLYRCKMSTLSWLNRIYTLNNFIWAENGNVLVIWCRKVTSSQGW